MEIRVTIQHGVEVTEHGLTRVIPCNSKQEATNMVTELTQVVSLFGETVTARVVVKKTITTTKTTDWV